MLLRAIADAGTLPAIRVAASGVETATPFSGVSVLMAARGVPALDLPAPPHREDPQHAQAFALVLLDRLRGGKQRPRLILIDDIDFFDESSQQVIGYLARRLTGTGIRLVCTTGPQPDSSPFSGVQRLSLGRFPEAALIELAAEESPATADPSVLKVIADGADGNPAAAVDIVRGLRPAQLQGTEPLCLPFRPGSTESAILLGTVASLSPAAHEVLAWLSSAPFVSLASLAFADAPTREAIPELINAGIISHVANGVSIRRPRLRSAVFWSLEPEQKSHIGRVLELATLPPLSAWHASFANFAPETAPGLRAGALTLIQEGNTVAAIELAERANALDSPAPGNALALTEIAEAFFRQGEIEHALHYSAHAMDADQNGGLDGGLRLRLAALRLTGEYHLSQRVDSWPVELAIREHGGQHPVAAALLQILLAAFSAGRWDLDRSRAALDAAAHLPGTAAPENQALFAAVTALLTALESGTPPRPAHEPRDPNPADPWAPMTEILFAQAHGIAEEYEQGRRILDTVLGGSAGQSRIWAAVARLQTVELERSSGNVGAALAAMSVIAKTPAPDVLRHSLCMNLAWYTQEVELGQVAEEWSRAAHQFNGGRVNPRVNGLVDSLRGAYALRSGAPEEALRSLIRCQETTAGLRNPQLLRYDANLVEAWFALGEHARAAEALDAFRERAARTPSRWAELTLRRSEALLTGGADSARVFAEVLQAFGSDELRFEYANTQAMFGARLAELGEAAPATQLLRAAEQSFRDIGLPKWAVAVRGSAPGRGPSGEHPLLARLTEPQRDVVELVLAGHKNRDIAQALFLSVRTVEVRLTGVYQSLGLKSRYELISRLSSPDTGHDAGAAAER